MQGLIDYGLAGPYHLNNNDAKSEDATYQIYFGLGHRLSLINTPGVYKTSLTGVRLGHYLLQSFDPALETRAFWIWAPEMETLYCLTDYWNVTRFHSFITLPSGEC